MATSNQQDRAIVNGTYGTNEPFHSIIKSHEHGIWPFVGLVAFEILALLLIVGGFYFIGDSSLSHQASTLSNLNSKSQSIEQKADQALKLSQEKSVASATVIPQDLKLKSLTVSGQTNVTNLQASNINTDTINGSTYTQGGNTSSSPTVISRTVTSGGSSISTYVATIGSVNGLAVSGNSGAGSKPNLSVIYGAGANTAVQGNSQLTCPAAGSNLTGGGGSITLGSGGSCSSIGVVTNPSFGGQISGTSNDIALSLSGVPSNNGTDSLLEIGQPLLSGNISVNGGTYIGINEPSSGLGNAADFIDFQNSGTKEFTVDSNGDIFLAGSASIQNTVNSTSEFSVQAAGVNGNTLFKVDSQNQRVYIGTNSSGTYTLNVGGSVNLEGANSQLYINDTPICNDSGCIGGGGGGSGPSGAINNSPSIQSPGNFYIQSTAAATPTAQIEAISGQTAPLILFEDDTGHTIAYVDASGNLSVQQATFNGHLISANTSGTTTIAVGSSNVTGTGSTATLSGNDTSGTITINTGSSAGNLTYGDLADITFAEAYKNTSNVGVSPHIVISPDNQNSASIGFYQTANSNGTGFSLDSRSAPSTNTTYTFDYIVVQ